ncbi:MAG: exodeoxyribonuclease III [Alphaproteobacteria bacterium]|nr:exodeoxyribonuclease III [Alphaproteobacteria bacterium]
MTRIATWNVNSIKARIVNVLDWLKEAAPDVVLLQETKVLDENFPLIEVEDLGYNVEAVGQKTYNGVAIFSKHPIEVAQRRLPGDDDDDQARYVEAFTAGLRVASIYLPNGNPVDSPKFTYKLSWMARLTDHVRGLLALEEPLVLGGDYNLCPTDADVYDPIRFADDALCRAESRHHYRALVNLGLTDSFRVLNPRQGIYSYWDYQSGRWNKDEGLRIDHLLLSAEAADRLLASGIDRTPRGKEKPSDHTPAWVELAEPGAA